MWMTELDIKRLGIKKFGKNCLISSKASIYGAENIEIGDNCRIDDFAIISAGKGGIYIGNYVHVACYVSLIGQGRIKLEDFSGLSGGVRVYSSTDDFSGEYLAGPTIPEEYTKVSSKEVIIGKFVTVGAGSVILPGVIINDNSAIGALSLVRTSVPENVIAGGNPCKFIKYRKKATYILEKSIYKQKMIHNNDGSFTLEDFFKDFEPKSDKNTSHAYINGYYSGEFSNKKELGIKLLEIGIRQGYSHILWDKYFPNGEIHGVDNGESGFTWEVLNGSRVKIYTEDAYNNKFTDKFDNDYFDYIIDDGSHHPAHQIKCIDLFLPKIKSGGKLIIEDVGNIGLAKQLETHTLKNSLCQSCKIIDLRSLKNQWDDIIIEIVRK